MKVYTDHEALLSVLKGGVKNNVAGHYRGRIASWMLRMSEYDVVYHHVKGTDNTLADGLSTVSKLMNSPRPESDDWENVAMVEVEQDGMSNESDIDRDVVMRQADILKKWKMWLETAWYGAFVTYKLPGTIKRNNHISDKVYRWTKPEAI